MKTMWYSAKGPNRVAKCLWATGRALPQWSNGLHGYPYTNELGVTDCAAWEPMAEAAK